MRRLLLILSILSVLALSACSSAVTASKLTRVQDGMKTDQVEKILGRPTRIDQSEVTGLTGAVYHYLSNQGDARVVLINDTVFAATFVPAGDHA